MVRQVGQEHAEAAKCVREGEVAQLPEVTAPEEAPVEDAAAKSLQSCSTLCDPIETAAHQAPPSLGFSRQEHWSGLPFPSPMHKSEK